MRIRWIDWTATVFIFLFTLGLMGSPSEMSFQEIPKKKLVGKLKGVAFAAIRTSIIKDYKFSEPKEIRYVPCSPDFPTLMGDFPCSLLSWDEEAVFVEETTSVTDAESAGTEPSLDDRLGGKVIVLLSPTKSPNIEGSVVKLGDEEDMLKLFYDKEGYLSHYTYQSSVIIFKWRAGDKMKTLSSILALKLDSNFFPISGKEIDLQNP
jgi:hypothetical protein